MGLMVPFALNDLYNGSNLCSQHSSSPTPSCKNIQSSMEEEDQKELQLLPSQYSLPASSSNLSVRSLDSSLRCRPTVSHNDQFGGPPLDLQLSMSVRPIQAPLNLVQRGPICEFGDAKSDTRGVEALKWQAAEQIRLAAIEKAYAERVRDLTRREMELAQSEFAKARQMWQRAREDAERAERLKERATRQVDSMCMEITCQSCRQRFKP